MKKGMKLLLLITLTSVLTLTSCSQAEPQIENINDELQPFIDTMDIPALAAVVISDGHIIAEGAVGVRKYGDPTPVTINDQFYLGSCTKAITATLIAILVEQKKLDWEKSMVEYFPELADKMLPKYQDITLLHLLSHHSGLPLTEYSFPPGTPEEYWWDTTDPIIQQRYKFMQSFLCQPASSEIDELPGPGTVFQYSNANYVIAAAIAEHVTGKSWEELLDTLLFQPLGMTTAGFGPMGTGKEVDQPWQHLHSVVSSYLHEQMQHLDSGNQISPISPDTPNNCSPPVLRPCGHVHMSLGDWAKFIIIHLEGEKGKSKLLKSASFKFLHTPPFSKHYALGWVLKIDFLLEELVYDHTGSNLLGGAYVRMSLERDFAVLIVTNIASFQAETAVNTFVTNQFVDRLIEK